MTVPGISDDVTIDAYGTYTISIAPYAFVRTLDLNDTGATLALAGGADLIVAGDATFSGGQITGNQGTLLLEGNTTVNGPTVIQGLLINNEGNLTISSYFRSDFGVTGARIILDPGAVAEFSGAIPGSPGVDEPIVFTAAGELVKFDGPIIEGPSGPISGFQLGDRIDLAGTTAVTATYSSGNLTLYEASGGSLQLAITTPYPTNFFGVSPDGNGGTILTVSPTPLSNPDLPWQSDGNSIFLQSDSGPAAIWTVSGTAFVGGGSLPNPGASWHATAPGDFNGDGRSDILLQNDSGQVAIWEMNGTRLIGGGNVANPGPSWHAMGVGDYNGDGRSDILLQSSSGDVAIWEMNGTSIIGGGVIANPGPDWHV